MYKFLTIFLPCENVHLIKDVGMLPYVLHNEHSVDSTIASYKNGQYEYIETEVKGLKQVFIQKAFNSDLFNIIYFLLKNHKKYDVLQCYDYSRTSIVSLCIFKILKWLSFQKSFTYLKLDAGVSIYNLKFDNKFKHYLFLRCVDLISVETKEYYNYLNKKNIFFKPTYYLPNGYYEKNNFEILYENKEDVILTVGRIGSPEKCHDILLNAFAKIADNNNWVLKFVGPINNDFINVIDSFFLEFPKLKNRVQFVGEVVDRRRLSSIYRTSKIFALTSSSEGFPLVFLEAMYSGCTIISSDVRSAFDVTDNQRTGKIFKSNDENQLAQLLEESINNDDYLFENFKLTRNFFIENYDWKIICKKLNDKILSGLDNNC